MLVTSHIDISSKRTRSTDDPDHDCDNTAHTETRAAGGLATRRLSCQLWVEAWIAGSDATDVENSSSYGNGKILQ